MPASEARHEIGAALRLSPVTAADRTAVAVDLRDRFPRTLALLDDGRISWLHAANLARGTEDLADETAALVEDAVLARLPRLTAGETRRAVADAVVRVDPAAAGSGRSGRRPSGGSSGSRTATGAPAGSCRCRSPRRATPGGAPPSWRRRSGPRVEPPASTTPGSTHCGSTSALDMLLGRDPLRDVTADPGSTSSSRAVAGAVLVRREAGRGRRHRRRHPAGPGRQPRPGPRLRAGPRRPRPGDRRRPRPGPLARRPRHR